MSPWLAFVVGWWGGLMAQLVIDWLAERRANERR